MKKILSILTVVVFCFAALSLQATDKGKKQIKSNKKKAKVTKTLHLDAASKANYDFSNDKAIRITDVNTNKK